MQYPCYRWQYNSVPGIIAAISVNQTYMLSIYVYIYMYITKGKETNKMEAWLIFITYQYNLNKQKYEIFYPISISLYVQTIWK